MSMWSDQGESESFERVTKKVEELKSYLDSNCQAHQLSDADRSGGSEAQSRLEMSIKY